MTPFNGNLIDPGSAELPALKDVKREIYERIRVIKSRRRV
jgi:hypothetical protein